MTRSALPLLLALATGAASIPAQSVVYSSFSPDSTYADTSESLAAGQKIAVSFTVPPDLIYTPFVVEVAGFSSAGSSLLLQLYTGGAPSAGGTAGPTIATAAFPTGAARIRVAVANAFPALQPNTTYWIEATTTGSVEWMHNDAGVTEPAEKFTSGSWISLAKAPVFRVKATTLNADPIAEGYGSYAPPSDSSGAPIAGLSDFRVEVICASGEAFTMPVGVLFDGDETAAEACQMLADAINNYSGDTCWHTANITCPTTAPFGFHADCMGSVLRVRNTTANPCLIAAVCIDHASYLNHDAGTRGWNCLTNPVLLSFGGATSGTPIDPTLPAAFEVTHLLRCGPGTQPQVFTASVPLSAGMTPQQLAIATTTALALQGDTHWTLAGGDVLFDGLCGVTGADYDLSFRANDSGLDWSVSPPLGFSLLTFVATNSNNPLRASNTTIGSGCYRHTGSFYERFAGSTNDLSGLSIAMIPSGAGYLVSPAGSSVVLPTGTGLALGDDQVSGAINLPFSFDYPGGSTTTIHVDANGSILLNGPGSSNLGGNVGALLDSPVHRICAAMQDLLPDGAANTNNVYAQVDPANPGAFLITWRNCPCYGAPPANRSTFQIALIDGGGLDTVELRYQVLHNDSPTNGGVCITGFSLGNFALDPGSTDLTAAMPFATEFDQSPLTLTAVTRPVLGTAWQLVTTNLNPLLPAIGFQIYGLGPGIGDLSPLGMPGCSLYANPAVSTLMFAPFGNVLTTSLQLPANPVLNGAQIYTTSAALSPENTFGWVTANGVIGRVGIQ